ncbi:MAG: UDP-2,3-diacylglucosamine diphosphatase LpxI [Verrucomicrobiota bacterium]|nr:UDP-2,3-diacylglucosamine diphosphatase LpxI [Verrucomicrobiota bacterium]
MSNADNINNLLIIAGRDNYPKIIMEAAKKSGVKKIHVIAFKGETKKRNLNLADSISWIRVGELQKMIDIIINSGFKNVIMVGQISPKNIFSLKLDTKAKEILKSLKILNAHSIFKTIVDEIETTGVRVLPANYFINNFIPSAGILTNRSLTEIEMKNLEIGSRFVKSNSKFDVGQTIALKFGYIIAVEAMEGTNATILRASRLAGKNVTIVKVPKLNHDLRFDIPVVGKNTIRTMIKANATCLGIEACRTVIFNINEVIEMANKNNIAIIASESKYE